MIWRNAAPRTILRDILRGIPPQRRMHWIIERFGSYLEHVLELLHGATVGAQPKRKVTGPAHLPTLLSDTLCRTATAAATKLLEHMATVQGQLQSFLQGT